ncbi:MAG TPA: hypothetical protein VMF90_09090 [Rhizobiaceae bacterium]|nr:hypothetical protein [Rhizobiaceae bacterium]
MRFIIAATALLLSAVAASASGGLSCEIDDAVLKLDVQSGVTRGMGSPVFNFQATADVLDKKAPEHLRKTSFTDEHLPQYWSDAYSLNLLLYRETVGDLPHGYVEITIKTQPNDEEEGSYAGDYELTVWDVGPEGSTQEPLRVSHAGKVTCFVE